jgi:hypothetical protein
MAAIVQIIPAGTWRARFDSGKRQPGVHAKPIGQTSFYTEPLACWALVEDVHTKDVVGMIPKNEAPWEVVSARKEPGFVGYESN